MNHSATTHLVERALDGALLGAFLISASAVTVALEHPASPVRAAIPDPLLRRALTGVAMGLTLVAIVYSSAGRRSGAHLNPVVTFTFFRLGKVAGTDAIGYIAAQFAGGVLAMALAAAALGSWLSDPAVNYARTVPGPAGVAAALAAEAAISFGMMLTVLLLSNSSYARWTGAAAGALVAVYISVEAPLSGMSMNPARSAAPALVAGELAHLWIYFAAPLAGMLAAAEAYVRVGGLPVRCAKLHHDARHPCIFRCGFAAPPTPALPPVPDRADRRLVSQV